jgi:predicted  nucleic acid-binding Zn ribbon protein
MVRRNREFLQDIKHNRMPKLSEQIPNYYTLMFSGNGWQEARWCAENCEGKWNFADWKSPGISTFHFELETDAAFFKLVWL